MNREAVILAGGFGTRLRSVVNDVPKPMAMVRGIPFLAYLLEELNNNGFTRAIIAAGYRHETINGYFGEHYKNIKLIYSIENEHLGTGGAIALAVEKVAEENFFIINGDTFFRVNFSQLERMFIKGKSNLTIALKEMRNFDRYGTVVTSGQKIISFREKKFCERGLINGGIYVINKKWFKENTPARIFSFEKDLLEKKISDNITFYLSDGYFIDIGIPEDYLRAERELPLLPTKTP
jgi:D-glycero-alpha-D-manno-heptose 1-phosphate guanylyltransferase